MSHTAITAAVVQTGGAPFELRDVEPRAVQPDEVLVRITASGICHTDLSSGTARSRRRCRSCSATRARASSRRSAPRSRAWRWATGSRAAIASCGGCAGCATGRPYYCAECLERNFGGRARRRRRPARSHDGGPVHGHFFGQSSFATRAIAPERSVGADRRRRPARAVAPFGCGVQTGAGGGLNVLRPLPGRRWPSSAPAASGWRR